MVNLKQIGGIILVATVGLMTINAILAIIDGNFSTFFMVQLIYLIVVLLGGILAFMGKTIGGLLALIVGALWLSTAILLNVEVYPPDDWVIYIMHTPWLSFFLYILDIRVWGFLYVETLLVLVAGVLGIVGSAD